MGKSDGHSNTTDLQLRLPAPLLPSLLRDPPDRDVALHHRLRPAGELRAGAGRQLFISQKPFF